MDKDYAQYLLKKTIQDYNLIAEEFSRTREYVPEDRKNLILRYIRPGSRVLDLGCGNGRFSDIFREDIDYIGVDNSEKMIEIAEKEHPGKKFQAASALNLPFSDNSFDVIFSFAVIHHIPSKELRLLFLKEAERILKSGGILILTAWYLNPIRMALIGEWGRAAELMKYQILKIFGLSKSDFGDFFVSWKNIVPRYIHCFSVNGLKKLVKKSGFKIKEAGILSGRKTKERNTYLVVQKIDKKEN